MSAVLVGQSIEGYANLVHSGRLIQISNLVWYAIARDSGAIHVVKSSDGGATWTAMSGVNGVFGSGGQVAAGFWFEPWRTAGADNIIHFFAHDDAGSRGLWYVNYNCDTDTVGTPKEIVSTGAASDINCTGGTKADGGRLWTADGASFLSDAGTWWSDDDGVTWTQFGASVDEGSQGNDAWLMWPDPAASDPDDATAFFWDYSADEISKKDLDASAGTIAETTVVSSIAEDAGKGNWSVSLSPTTEHFRLVALSAGATPTIRTFDITGTTVVEKAAVISATADVENVAISIFPDNDASVVYYERAGEVYFAVSLDAMATWGAETRLNSVDDSDIVSLAADPVPRNSTEVAAAWLTAGDDLFMEVPTTPLASAVTQYRLMLAETTAPDVPVLNITDKAIADAGEPLIKTERGRESAVLGRPARAGRASVVLNNYGLGYNLDQPTPGLAIRLNKKYNGTWYQIWQGNIDVPEQEMQQGVFRPVVKIQANGTITKLANKKVSTALYSEITTGTAIGHVLDAADFPSSLRDIDAGDVTLPWFWASDEDALTLIQKLVNSEGITAELYEGADGKLVFRDRSARYDESRSSSIQTTFTAQGSEPRLTGFTYVSGWREIVNEARATRLARVAGVAPSVVWTDNNGDGNYIIGPSDRVILEAVSTEPFQSAITPVLNTDYASGFGTGTVTLERTSGQRARITFTAGAGGWLIGPASGNDGIQLRATETVLGGTFAEINDSSLTTDSIAKYGVRAWTGQMWPDMNWWDVRDNLDAIVTWLKEPRGRIRLGLNAAREGAELTAANEATAKREIGDRVRVTVPDLDFDGECWIERIEHEVFAPAGMADGTSVGREFTWYECSVIEVAVGSQGTGVTDTNPYDALNYEDYVGPPSFADQGVTTTKNIMAGAL